MMILKQMILWQISSFYLSDFMYNRKIRQHVRQNNTYTAPTFRRRNAFWKYRLVRLGKMLRRLHFRLVVCPSPWASLFIKRKQWRAWKNTRDTGIHRRKYIAPSHSRANRETFPLQRRLYLKNVPATTWYYNKAVFNREKAFGFQTSSHNFRHFRKTGGRVGRIFGAGPFWKIFQISHGHYSEKIPQHVPLRLIFCVKIPPEEKT